MQPRPARGQMPSLGWGGSPRVGRGRTGRSGHMLGPRWAARERGGQDDAAPFLMVVGGCAGRSRCWACAPTVQVTEPRFPHPSSGNRHHGHSAMRGPPRRAAAGNSGPSVGLVGSSVGDKRRLHPSAPRGKVRVSGLASWAPSTSLVAAAPPMSVSSSPAGPLCGRPPGTWLPCVLPLGLSGSRSSRGGRPHLPGPPWARLWASARAGLPGGDALSEPLAPWGPRLPASVQWPVAGPREG